MKYIDKVKNKISEVSEAHAEARAERERQRMIREKEERKRAIVKISLEAEEFGISMSEYLQYLTYKELNGELESIASRFEDIERTLGDIKYNLRDDD